MTFALWGSFSKISSKQIGLFGGIGNLKESELNEV